MKYILILLFCFTTLFSSSNYSQKKIKFTGKVKEEIKKRVSIANIEKLGLKEYKIIDPYTKKNTNYSGVDLKLFANFYGKEEVESIVFKAIDGYEVTITKNEWQKYNILLATKLNNEYVSYDKKGPLRIIFPNYKLASENFAKNLPKWIWMINSIEFK